MGEGAVWDYSVIIVKSYQVRQRDHELNWGAIAEALGEAKAPLAIVQVMNSAPPDSFYIGGDRKISYVLPFLLSPKWFW